MPYVDLTDGPDWVQFDDPRGLFSIRHPRRWAQVEVVSQGAALSCRAEDGSVLFEVMCFQKDEAPGPGERTLVAAVVDGLAKYAAHDVGMYRGRVIAQNSFPFGGAEACTDLLVAYHDDNDVQISVDYFTVGTGRDALYVALKTPTGQFPAEQPDFERALGTLRTPWMCAAQAPSLASGTGHGGGSSRGFNPEVKAWLDRELNPPPPPKRKGGCTPWIIAIAVAAAAVWWFFLRH